MPGGFEGKSGEFTPSASQTGPAKRASVLFQTGHLSGRGLGVIHTVDHLAVLLPQASFAEMLHGSQHHYSRSPEEKIQQEL